MNPAAHRLLFPLWLVVTFAIAITATLETYRYSRDRRTPNEVVLPLRVDRRGPVRFFYDVGRGFNAADSTAQPAWPTRTPLELRFPVPTQPIRGLRFEPPAGDRALQIGPVRFETASGMRLGSLPLSAIHFPDGAARSASGGGLLRVAATPGGPDTTLEIRMTDPVAFPPNKPPVGWIVFAAFSVLPGLAFRSELARLTRYLRTQIAALAVPDGTTGFWTGAFLAGFAQLWLLWPLHRVLDLPLWDEAGYMSWSARWMETGSPGRHLFNCPLYVLQYLAELRIFGDTGSAFFFHQYFFKIATTVLVYAIVARACRNWPAALSLALVGAVSAFQAQQPIMVYQAALFWLLLAILAADASPLNALGCLLLALCVRQEYQFALATFAVWLAWQRWRGRITWAGMIARRPERRRLALITALPVFALAIYVFSHVAVSGSSGRAWFAFQQHYAIRAVVEGRAPGINPWIDYPQVIQRDFPGIHSLADAVRAHPAKVVRHVAGNLSRVPAALLDLVRPQSSRWAITGLLAVAFVVFASRRPANAVPHSGPGAGTAVAFATIPGLSPGLFIYAKDAYLLAALPCLALVVSGTLIQLVRLLPPPRLRSAAWTAIGVALVVGAAAMAERPFAGDIPERPLAEAVAALDLHWPEHQRLKLLAAPAITYRVHLGPDRCTAVEGLGSVFGNTRRDAAFATLLAEARPDVVLLTPEWTDSAGFDRAGAEALLQGQGWTALPLARGTAFFAPSGRVLP